MKGLLVEAVMTSNRMFSLHYRSAAIDQTCVTSTTPDMARHILSLALLVWSFEFQGIKDSREEKMVLGLPQFRSHISLCEDYMLGKQHGYVFPKESTWRAVEVLQLIYVDICEPISPNSNNKKSLQT